MVFFTEGEEESLQIPPPFWIAVFPLMVQWVMVGRRCRNRSAPLSAVFPLMVQLVMVAEEPLSQPIPPLVQVAVFPLMEQLVMVGEEFLQ
jgi:hypothetical protein